MFAIFISIVLINFSFGSKQQPCYQAASCQDCMASTDSRSSFPGKCIPIIRPSQKPAPNIGQNTCEPSSVVSQYSLQPDNQCLSSSKYDGIKISDSTYDSNQTQWQNDLQRLQNLTSDTQEIYSDSLDEVIEQLLDFDELKESITDDIKFIWQVSKLAGSSDALSYLQDITGFMQQYHMSEQQAVIYKVKIDEMLDPIDII